MAIVTVGSHSMEYEQAGSGPDLLLVHSLLTEMTVFEPVMAALTARHRVTRVNLPGFGASTPVDFQGLAGVADHADRMLPHARTLIDAWLDHVLEYGRS